MKTFIVRLEVDEVGDVLGVVERVRSGAKERFRGYPMLGDVVRRMVAADDGLVTRSSVERAGKGASMTTPRQSVTAQDWRP